MIYKGYKKLYYKLFIVLLFTLILFTIACSSSETDKAVGVYEFVYERAPLKSYENLDSKMVLDGHGKGEYYREENVHKIKYTFDDPNIVITDSLTGIKYTGTLSEGELHLLDGPEGGGTTSEFLFKSKNSY